jgi:hypothetical protein
MDNKEVQQEACGDTQQRIAAFADIKVKMKLLTAQAALWNAMQAKLTTQRDNCTNQRTNIALKDCL